MTACQEQPELFFSTNRVEIRKAKALCGECPLIAECRERGWSEVHGVWGGLSAVDRKRLDPDRYQEAVKLDRERATMLDDWIVARRAERDRLAEADDFGEKVDGAVWLDLGV